MRAGRGTFVVRSAVQRSLIVTLLVVVVGCAASEPPPGRRDLRYADLIERERSAAGGAAKDLYEKTGQVPFLGTKPQCVEELPPCIVERARWEVVNYYREWLFSSVLQCEEGQTECLEVRRSERAMRKLVYRRWRKEQDEKAEIEAARRAHEEERLRGEEEAKLSEWHAIEEEERFAREAREQQLASIRPSAPREPARVPHDWEAEAHAVVRGLQSRRVGCTGGFGETQFLDRVWALQTLEAMGPGDAGRIESIVDASHGSGVFRKLVGSARHEVSAFIPRRCVAGL